GGGGGGWGAGGWWVAGAWLAVAAAAIGWVVAGRPGLAAALPVVALAALRASGRAGSAGALLIGTLVGVVGLGAVLLARAPAPPTRQLVVIGLDAASWDFIDRLRAAGRMPTFERLVHAGARGELDTVFPVIS